MYNQKLREYAAAGNIEQCEKLLQRSDVDIHSAGPTTGRTALHWAVEKKHYDLVHFLLEKGARFTPDLDGYTPYALTTEMRMTRILGPYLRFQLNPSRSTPDLERQFRQVAAEGNIEQCRVLFENGVNINAAGPGTGKTALYWAVIKNKMRIVEFLIESGVLFDHNVKKIHELNTSYQIKRALFYRWPDDIDSHFLPSVPDFIQSPAGHQYGFHLSAEVTQFMAKEISGRGEISNVKTLLTRLQADGIFALHGRPVLSLINNNTADGSYRQDMIKFCLQLGFDPNLKAHEVQFDSYKGTCLMEILANEKVSRAKEFIHFVAEHSAIQIDPTVQDAEQKTILHMATLLPQSDYLEFILTQLNCTDAINLQDDDGNTPLHHAYFFGDMNNIRLLEERGALILENKNGQTPLDRLHSTTTTDVTQALKKFHIVPVRGTEGRKLSDLIEERRVLTKISHPKESPESGQWSLNP